MIEVGIGTSIILIEVRGGHVRTSILLDDVGGVLRSKMIEVSLRRDVRTSIILIEVHTP